jgi:hypothetical protein
MSTSPFKRYLKRRRTCPEKSARILHGFSWRMPAFAGVYCRFVLIGMIRRGRKNGGFLRFYWWVRQGLNL